MLSRPVYEVSDTETCHLPCTVCFSRGAFIKSLSRRLNGSFGSEHRLCPFSVGLRSTPDAKSNLARGRHRWELERKGEKVKSLGSNEYEGSSCSRKKKKKKRRELIRGAERREEAKD